MAVSRGRVSRTPERTLATRSSRISTDCATSAPLERFDRFTETSFAASDHQRRSARPPTQGNVMTRSRRSTAKLAAAMLLSSALAVSAWPSPASAASSTGTFVWRSIKSGRCVDADLNTIGANGTRVQLWDCNHQAQQNWISYPDGTIRSSKNGKCLDADLNTIRGNGTKVQLWTCNGQLQQRWTIAPGSRSGSHRLISQHSGRCVDADLNTINSNGTRVQLWDCNSQPQQDWQTLYY